MTHILFNKEQADLLRDVFEYYPDGTITALYQHEGTDDPSPKIDVFMYTPSSVVFDTMARSLINQQTTV